MALDIDSLCQFYGTPLGGAARRLVSARIRRLWPDLRGQRLLGYGFAAPYLGPFHAETERAIAATPVSDVLGEATATRIWAPGDRNLNALVAEPALPFPDAMFDRVLLVHGLEMCEAERPFLRELWRVLAPQGRLLMVVPNRTSLWAQFETTPFANGRPYTRSQLALLLEHSLFAAEAWDVALMLPPLFRGGGGGTFWERLGRKVWPELAGVHIVEATKSLYAFAPPKPSSGLRQPVLARAGSARRPSPRSGPYA